MRNNEDASLILLFLSVLALCPNHGRVCGNTLDEVIFERKDRTTVMYRWDDIIKRWKAHVTGPLGRKWGDVMKLSWDDRVMLIRAALIPLILFPQSGDSK